MELARQGNLERTGAIDRDNEFKMIAEAYNETITSLKEQMENNQKNDRTSGSGPDKAAGIPV